MLRGLFVWKYEKQQQQQQQQHFTNRAFLTESNDSQCKQNCDGYYSLPP